MDELREVLANVGAPVRQLLIVLEIETTDDQPINVAGTWPLGQLEEAAKLCAQGGDVFRMQLAVQQMPKGQG